VLLRQSWREGKTVKHATMASLTHLPSEVIDTLEAVLNRGAKAVVPTPVEVQVGTGLRHGDVAAIWTAAKQLGLPAILGPACPQRDIALGLIIARLAHPASKLATLAWFGDTTLGVDLGLDQLTTDETYRAMDWLVDRQVKIERALTRRHLTNRETNPDRLVLIDLTSTWMEGTGCPLTNFGYSRDGKKGKPQIEFALVTNPDGVPVAVKAFEGNTGDPTACTTLIDTITTGLEVKRAVVVGDRGMLTSTRIEDLAKAKKPIDWVSALTRPQFRRLAADTGPLQMSLFDTHNLAEITDPAFPGERLIACHNPPMGEHRARKRQRLIDATIKDLDKITAGIKNKRLRAEKQIGLAVGKVIGAHQAARFFNIEIGASKLVYQLNEDAIEADRKLDGIYVIRTSLTSQQMDTPNVVLTYKRLSHVEQDFAMIKGSDIQVRPIWHHRADRVEAHLLICMLACYLSHHLRQTWAALTYTDTQPDPEPDPVKARHRSKAADIKAATHTTELDTTALSFRGLLEHLAGLQRVTVSVTLPTGPATYDRITQPTDTQTKAFELLAAPIPTSLGPSHMLPGKTRRH